MLKENIQICKAKSNHIDQIYMISALSFSISWSKESIRKEIEDNSNALYLVAVKDNLVLGYAGIWLILDEGHITNIAVHPKYRGFGIASLILDTLINTCKNREIKNITLEVRVSNLSAQNLYKKFDFIEEGKRKKYYADNAEDALIMWKHNI